ncbi:hypothetical protein QBC43DRAFT_304553 [Cladorrhinum sp. PSN259]|nr:hypothetical protein QBC43DRAFT_304553 [Cladorrhinum sp. PSN259]
MSRSDNTRSSVYFTPEAIIACATLFVSLPPTLAVLVYWGRRHPWKLCVNRHRQFDDEENEIHVSPSNQRRARAIQLGLFELPG